MSELVLARSDIGRFVDFEATRVELPRLYAQALTRAFDVSFEVFEEVEAPALPTPFTGPGGSRSWALTVRYFADEHAEMRALQQLVAAAHASPDPRLLLRPNTFLDADLNAVEVVVVAGDALVPVEGQIWDFTCTATAVVYTVSA